MSVVRLSPPPVWQIWSATVIMTASAALREDAVGRPGPFVGEVGAALFAQKPVTPFSKREKFMSESSDRYPQREAWLQRWLTLLGDPGYPTEEYRAAGVKAAEKIAETVCDAPDDGFEVRSYRLEVGPGERQKIILLRPTGENLKKKAIDGKLPCVVVPFYHPETPAGLEPDSERRGLIRVTEESLREKRRQFGVDLARRGYLVVCTEAYPFNMAPPQPGEEQDGFARWRAAAACLKERYPAWTGLGKLVHDARCAITFLLQQPDADSSRLAIMGHSLGGKIAFYTGCLDERVKAVIASDFGLPWASTNWDDAWYLGEKRPSAESDLTHDKLLGLLSPGAFFLIAGETDNEESWAIVNKARPYFAAAPEDNQRDLDGGGRLAWFNHATGHSPTLESLSAAYEWLDRRW